MAQVDVDVVWLVLLLLYHQKHQMQQGIKVYGRALPA